MSTCVLDGELEVLLVEIWHVIIYQPIRSHMIYFVTPATKMSTCGVSSFRELEVRNDYKKNIEFLDSSQLWYYTSHVNPKK